MRETNHKRKLWRFRISERKTLLVIGDFIMAVAGLILALFVWAKGGEWLGFSVEFLLDRVPMWFYLLPFLWLVLLVELYDPHKAASVKGTIRGIGTAAIIGMIAYSLVYLVSTPGSLPRIGLAVFVLATAGLTLAWRLIYIRVFTTPSFLRRVLLVGAGRSGKTLLDVLSKINPPPFQVIGILDDDPDKENTMIKGYPVFGGSAKLQEIIDEHGITDVIVAISGEIQGHTFQNLLDAQESGIEISRMPVVYEDLLGRVPIQLLEADWLLRSFLDEYRVNGFYEVGKRLLDILGGLVGLFILIIIFPFVGVAIVIDSGFPIIYKQTRLGKRAKPYQMIKFRTMRQDAEADGRPRWATEDDKRATKIGKFLRKTHLDEIPQFINVLMGEMSLVGPRSERPELVEHFQKYVPFYRARLLVKPGITGWAQINYPYAASIEETIAKLEYDLYYIKHRNLVLDMVIMFRTPSTMLGMQGQ